MSVVRTGESNAWSAELERQQNLRLPGLRTSVADAKQEYTSRLDEIEQRDAQWQQQRERSPFRASTAIWLFGATTTAGIAAGTLLGTRLGGSAPIYGALIGAGIGGIGGAFATYFTSKPDHEHRREIPRERFLAWHDLWATTRDAAGTDEAMGLLDQQEYVRALNGDDLGHWDRHDDTMTLPELVGEFARFDHDGDERLDVRTGSSELVRDRRGGPVTPSTLDTTKLEDLLRDSRGVGFFDGDGDGFLSIEEAVEAGIAETFEANRNSGLRDTSTMTDFEAWLRADDERLQRELNRA